MKNSQIDYEINNFKTIDQLYAWYLQEENQKPDSREVQEYINEYEQTTKGVIPGDLGLKLWDSVCGYGESRERKGFRDGFRLAFHIMQEVQG